MELSRSPALGIAKAIQEALDPVRAPSKGRTLNDMSAEEIRALEQKYGAKVKNP